MPHQIVATRMKVQVEVGLGSQEIYDIETDVARQNPAILATGTPEEFVDFLSHGGSPSCYVTYVKSHAVGYVAINALHDSDAMEVRSIAVEQAYQHAGHGKSMMLLAEELAVQNNRTKMTLVTSPANTHAVQFYQALAYVITKEVADYYGDGTSRYILEKELNS